jgi:hypothetical protein
MLRRNTPIASFLRSAGTLATQEPNGPSVKVQIPGPSSQKIHQKLQQVHVSLFRSLSVRRLCNVGQKPFLCGFLAREIFVCFFTSIWLIFDF